MRRSHRVGILAALCLVSMAGPAAAVIYNTTIYAIQQGSFAINDTVLVDSVVVIGIDVRPSTYGVYVQEPAGGAYSGILAYMAGTYPTYTPPSLPPAVGDLITVKGRYAEFSGLSEIDGPTLTYLSAVTPLTPVKLPVDSLETTYPGSERWEGVLVRVDSVQVTSVDGFRTWRFHHYNCSGLCPDSLAAYEKMISGQVVPAVGDRVNVIGVADYAFNERRVAPRNDNDITFLTPLPAAVPNLAYSPAENKIKVRFNVRLNTADAQTPSKYSLSTFQTISSAVYDDPNKTVTLTVGTNLVPSVTPHVLSMSGIRNVQNLPMVDPQTISFIGGICTIDFVQTPVSSTNDSSRVANQQVTFRGVVTASTVGAVPDFPGAIGGFYMQRRGATQYGGIFVYGPPMTPARGDSVLVSGLVTEFGVGPETEITSVDEVTVLGNATDIPPPGVLLGNASGSNPAEAEKYEGMLIKIAGATTISNAFPPGPGTPFDISQNLAGADTLRVDDLAIEESYYEAWRGDVIDVAGIIRFSGTAPFRRLQPRHWAEPPTGDIHVVSRGNVSEAPPGALRTQLLQNHPNPFNPTTEIVFTLAGKARAAVRVYDVQGKLVRALFDGEAIAGRHRLTWDGRDGRGRAVGTGVYFYRLVTGGTIETRKMIMLK